MPRMLQPPTPSAAAPLLLAAVAATLGTLVGFVWWRLRTALCATVGIGLLAWAAVLVLVAPAAGAWWPYAGLLLGVLLTWRVLDSLLAGARALQARNAELGRQVAVQNAELQQALDQMRSSRDAARAADQAKTQFLAAASHDLRQPAHALGLYMAALRAGPLLAEQAELAERISASLAALDSMFAALLDVSRIDAGAVLPHWDLVALAPLLRRLADEWAPEAEARGLRLALRAGPADAVTVTDAMLLERVLRNLLANAVKYTQHGGVLLACRSRVQADGRHAWRVEVWDSGIGIAAGDHERVFEEFVQVGNPGRDRQQAPGLGLGLAIVRRLARLLQLRLVLHSRPGRGSVFMIDGLTPAGAVPQRAAAARGRMRRLAGTLVVVIEDDADIRDAMRRLLRLWDCRVVDGGHSGDVLRQLPAESVAHAVVADLRLADGRRGPAEAQALFAAWGRSVPLLLVSGETAAGQLRDLQQAGHTCLAKPVSPARLRAWLEQAVDATASEVR